MSTESFKNKLINEALEIFEELPNHRGYAESSLTELEQKFGGPFPPTYRQLLLLDADRMAYINGICHPSRLVDMKTDAEELLERDSYQFQLQPNHIVFGWEDEYGFYFFETSSSDDIPVYLFNYYDDSDKGLPRIYATNVREHLGWVVRRYLNLGLTPY